VSDTLASALWSIDLMLTSAENGSSGINFHGGGPLQDPGHLDGFVYTPIDEANSQVTAAKPLFHGMLFVMFAGTGDMLATTATAGALNFTAYTIAQADGATNVVLVNKDATSGVQASVDVGTAVTAASAIYLQGSSLTATTGVTFAGSSVSPAGAWSPSPPFALSAKGNVVNVIVPPASAALVHAR
jgi:hypothetical protein